MKFHFENIGPIKKTELELGDLTIIAGRNNTGKTYLAYTLYGFLKPWIGWQRISIIRNLLYRKNPVINVEKIITGLRKGGQYTWKISRGDLNGERRSVIKQLAREFSRVGIAEVFSSPHGSFENADISVKFDSDDFPDIPASALKVESPYPRGMSISTQYDGEHLIFSMQQSGKRVPSEAMNLSLSVSYVVFLLSELPHPFILSTERFGISLFYKELDFTKNRLVEMIQEMGDKGSDRFSPFIFLEKNASRYALPIKDNIDYTRDIPNIVKGKSELENSKLYDDVKNIMGGYYKSSDNDVRFISKRKKERRFDIPLHIASSSARGLSDLYFYLRHQAKPNQLLIIDEPESHLDTKNQIMLARMLSHFVRAGIRVLITTHSDYILKEINNLIMLSSTFRDKDQVIKKLKYKENECLAPESLRCYVAENGGLTACKVDKFGVEVPIFDKTIDEINKVSNELAYRLEDTSEE